MLLDITEEEIETIKKQILRLFASADLLKADSLKLKVAGKKDQNMLKNYFKIAWRSLWKNKSISLINLGGLAVGMAAAILIMFWVQNELSYDTYHPKSGQIYRITNYLEVADNETWKWENSPLLLSEFAKKEIPDIEKVALFKKAVSVLNLNGKLFREEQGAFVNDEWFDVFHYEFLQGNAASFFKNPYSLLLTEKAAKKYFGNKDPLGQTIRIDTTNFQVQGVLKDNPSNSSFNFNILIPVSARFTNAKATNNDRTWGNFNYVTFLQLKEHADPKKVSGMLTSIIKKNREDSKTTSLLLPLKEMHFETDLQSSVIEHQDRKQVYVFSILSVLLLLIGCINYVNLTTAKASLRTKEVSVKKIVGANRLQLFYQFMVESVVTGVIAILFAFVLIQLSLPYFNEFVGQSFKLFDSSLTIVAILTITLLLTILMTGIYPALLLSSLKPLNIFRGNNLLEIKDATLRKLLVVLQFSISIVFIICMIIIFKQHNYIGDKHPGYNMEQIFTISIPYSALKKHTETDRNLFLNTLKNEFLTESSISGVSRATGSIVNLQSSFSGGADWEGHIKGFDPTMVPFNADADFYKLLKPELKEGRWFNPDIKNDQNNFILNETAVKELQLKHPVIGQRFKGNSDSGKVVGVVKDFHYRSLHEKIGIVVISNNLNWCLDFYIKAAPGNITGALTATEKIWKRHITDQPFEYSFMDTSFENLYKAEQKISAIMTLFSIIAILISCLGLFGLAAFTVERRIKEIGIRKILGANVSSIIIMISKEFILLVFIALLIASPIGWLTMNKWLQDFAYHVSIEWWVFALAGSAALLITMVTVSFQAVKAALANPVKSLRTE